MSAAVGSPVKYIALTIATAVTVAVAFPVYAQQQDEAFKAGLNARRDSKWEQAAAHMQRAIKTDPKESQRKVGGNLFGGGTEYLPHYFLGEALFKLGRCADAVRAWSNSEQQGLVQTRQEYSRVLKDGYAVCEAKGVLPPAKYVPLLARAQQQIKEVTDLATTITNQGQAHADVWHANPGMKEDYDRGREEIQSARSRLDAAAQTRLQDDFSEAIAAADRARGVLGALRMELDGAIARAGAAIRKLTDDVSQTIDAAQKRDNEIEGRKKLLTPSLVALRQDAVVTLNRARDQFNARPVTETGLTDARKLAQESSAQLKQVFDEIEQLERRALEEGLARVAAHADQVFASVENDLATITSLVDAKPSRVGPEFAGRWEAARKKFDDARRRLEAAQRRDQLDAVKVDGIRKAADLAGQVSTDLQNIITSFGPLTLEDRGVPAWLQTGASLFFQGEYEKSLAALDPAVAAAHPSIQLHAHLFRAAALHALYIHSGETNQSHRTQALAEIDRCKAINPAFQPDQRAFAPGFISFFLNGSEPDSQPQQPRR